MKLLLPVLIALFVAAPQASALTQAEYELLEQVQQRLLTLYSVSKTAAVPTVAGASSTVDPVIESTPVVTIETEWSGTFTAEAATVADAQIACEEIAYNTDYMWQDIMCDYDGTVIYDDVFIAG